MNPLKQKKILFAAIFFLLLIGSILNWIHPIQFKNPCNDSNIFRYQFGIYEIDTTITDEVKFNKIGDFPEFIGLKEIKCLTEIENEKYTQIKNKIDSINQSLEWKKLRCGLWRNKKGDLGFKTSQVVGMEGLTTAEIYITKFGFNEDPPLNTVIDTLTFHELGNTYYKDKNHIYHSYAMTDGGSFYVFEEADHETFEIVGGCYAKDKNHIYEMRAGIMVDADHKTFISKADIEGCFAKDKNGYFAWDRRIEKEDFQDEYVQKAVKELGK